MCILQDPKKPTPKENGIPAVVETENVSVHAPPGDNPPVSDMNMEVSSQSEDESQQLLINNR